MRAARTLRTRLGPARRYLKFAWDSLWRASPTPSRRHTNADLLDRVEEWNSAAERHWQMMNADQERRRYLLEKPFAALRETPAILYRLGLTLEALDLGLGHTVLDFGAGSCWLSVILNRLRCRTIAVDVSPTALSIGRELLASEPRAHPELQPQFLAFDGRTIRLPAESVDRVVCFDAFHHVPNQDQVLGELFRVLRPGGRVVMAEPGEGHAHADASEFDCQSFGVLENELLPAELVARVRRAGFGEVQVKPYPDVSTLRLSATAHLRLLAGDYSFFPLDDMIDSLRQFHLLILLKGQPVHDSRNPRVLHAKITVPEGTKLAGRAGTLARISMMVENTGDTTWLSAENRQTGGYVGIGAHLFDDHGGLLRLGFLVDRLPRDVAPGERVEVESAFAFPERAGRFQLRLDLVAEGIAWFSQRGSPTTDVEMSVDWSDSRDPHRFDAHLEPLGTFPPRSEGGAFPLRLRLTNRGDTIWLSDPHQARGTVSVGVQQLDHAGNLVDMDYFRIPLPGPVEPGESVFVDSLVPKPAAGAQQFAVDLVAEQICWFVSHGSRPLAFTVE